MRVRAGLELGRVKFETLRAHPPSADCLTEFARHEE